jgi:hypothetical protein
MRKALRSERLLFWPRGAVQIGGNLSFNAIYALVKLLKKSCCWKARPEGGEGLKVEKVSKAA